MLSIQKFCQRLLRLPAPNLTGSRNISVASGPLCIHVSNALLGEPLKKRKKVDPNVLRKREERKRKKLQKQIRRLEKLSVANLKLVDELQVPLKLMDEMQIRSRPETVLSEEEFEAQLLLRKNWSGYRHKLIQRDQQAVQQLCKSQLLALDQLKLISMDLYMEALKIDEHILPYRAKGPSYTPPLKGYHCPNGKYIDRTFVYPGEDNHNE